jgi:hypothetical protein
MTANQFEGFETGELARIKHYGFNQGWSRVMETSGLLRQSARINGVVLPVRISNHAIFRYMQRYIGPEDRRSARLHDSRVGRVTRHALRARARGDLRRARQAGRDLARHHGHVDHGDLRSRQDGAPSEHGATCGLPATTHTWADVTRWCVTISTAAADSERYLSHVTRCVFEPAPSGVASPTHRGSVIRGGVSIQEAVVGARALPLRQRRCAQPKTESVRTLLLIDAARLTLLHESRHWRERVENSDRYSAATASFGDCCSNRRTPTTRLGEQRFLRKVSRPVHRCVRRPLSFAA